MTTTITFMNNGIKIKYTTIINYLFIFLTINYNIITSFVTHIDSTGYAIMGLSFVVLLLNRKSFMGLQLKKPIIFWLFWCLYAVLNYYLRRSHENSFTVFELYSKIFIPLILMTVVVSEYGENPNRTLWLCFITHAIYTLLGCYFDRNILHRIDDEENVLGNAFATTSCLTLFYLTLLNRKKKIDIVLFILLAVVISVVLAMSGTRKAFGAGEIM